MRKTSSWKPLFHLVWVSSVLFILFVVGSTLYFGRAFEKAQTAKGGLFQEPSVGVLEVKGVILDSKKISDQLEEFEESPDIKAIVLRVDSPGGAVAPSQEIYEDLKRATKPIVVSMGNVAASGGYYIAMAGKKIFANPGTITGSIGVIMEFANLEKLYEWAKVKRYAIKTGKFKDVGSETRAMTDDERNLLQEMMFNVLSQFKAAVASGRKMQNSKVDEIADGRIFSGEQAKRLGMIDELGGIHEAIAAAAKLGGITKKPKVVYPNKKRNLMELLQFQQGDEDSKYSGGGSIASWLRNVLGASIGAPKALEPGMYWIWTGGVR